MDSEPTYLSCGGPRLQVSSEAVETSSQPSGKGWAQPEKPGQYIPDTVFDTEQGAAPQLESGPES